MPPGLIAIARQMARAKPTKPENLRQRNAQVHLIATVMAFPTVMADAGLSAIIHEKYGPTSPAAKEHGEGVLRICRGRIFDRVFEAPSREIARGATMRRAVAKARWEHIVTGHPAMGALTWPFKRAPENTDEVEKGNGSS